ncbi:MAG: DUF5749 family beta-barrel protein [Thermoplasmatota archaeon]
MARGSKKPKTQMNFDPKDFKDEYLSRFLKDKKGDVKGETIDFEGDDLVVKKGDEFFRVPISSVELEEEFLMLKKRVDWKKAKVMGEKWRKRELDPL